MSCFGDLVCIALYIISKLEFSKSVTYVLSSKCKRLLGLKTKTAGAETDLRTQWCRQISIHKQTQ